ncbi:MAG: hypothetical protein Q4D44_08175 [Eubacteriales bacterium]|nr:hypothetical protein [Eubacteriales bacterium]
MNYDVRGNTAELLSRLERLSNEIADISRQAERITEELTELQTDLYRFSAAVADELDC